jgi:hypothetical protein
MIAGSSGRNCAVSARDHIVVARAAVYGPSQGSLRKELIAAASLCALTGVRETRRLFLLLDQQDRHVRGSSRNQVTATSCRPRARRPDP